MASSGRCAATSRSLTLPAISADGGTRATLTAINDVALHRKVGERVAELAYGVGGEDGRRASAATASSSPSPAGSTGYNLANGGPVMAWGVEGFVVSFIAPHSLTARALVVAPDDALTVHNRSPSPVDVTRRRRPAASWRPATSSSVRFVATAARPRPAAGLVVLPPPAREVRPPERRRRRDGTERPGSDRPRW